MKKNITFLLNNELVSVEVAPALVALDYLRKNKLLTGTKEGCKEGDCGACTVIVGEMVSDEVNYKPMTSCLLPMGELHGKHLVSIEGLNMEQLSPVQAAMVDCGGTQCGYCTPGFVVAMTAGLMDKTKPLNAKGVEYSISGNLCRCTGYRSIKEAGAKAFTLLKPKLSSSNRIADLAKAGAIPNFFENVAERLNSIPKLDESPSTEEDALPMIAGGTDLLVQKGESLASAEATLLNCSPIQSPIECEGIIRVDPRMNFEDFGNHPLIQSAIPKIQSYNELIASWPIRTRASLGGNICNASPIADMTSLLLAMEAQLEIGKKTIPLRDFFIGYKQLAKEDKEQVTAITFPKPSPHSYINWEKVSKRKILDIASINSAAKIEIVDGTISDAHLSLGGVAATPLFLKETSERLKGKSLELEPILKIIDDAQDEFNPISDVRGSANYKRLLARQLLVTHFSKLFPNIFSEEALHAALR